jgi:hypothetical protein
LEDQVKIMKRRSFLMSASCAVVGSCGACLLGQHAGQKDQPIRTSVTVGGFELGFSPDKGFTMQGNVLKLAGFDFPPGDWGWVATGLAEGIVSLIGGQIISAISQALFGSKQPDLGQLLQRQLQAIGALIEQLHQKFTLQDCTDALDSNLRLMSEYINTPNGAGKVIQHLVPDTSKYLSILKNMGYVGYPLFLQFGGLRLAILQDLAEREGGRAIDNFKVQQQEIRIHHEAVIEEIRAKTEPAANFGFCDDGTCFFSPVVERSANVLGHNVHGKVKFSRHSDGHYYADSAESINVYVKNRSSAQALLEPSGSFIDWIALRKQIMTESVDKGAPIVAQFMSATPRLQRRAAAMLRARWRN